MNNTPNANRLHVAIFGRRNSGKSSLLNAISGEDVSLVSDVAGTTTDVVARSMELRGVGAVLFIDTPGFDDEGDLGERRVERAARTTQRTDIALLLCEDGDLGQERSWAEEFKRLNIPTIPVINKIDTREDITAFASRVEQALGEQPLMVSAQQGIDIEVIREVLLSKIAPDQTERTLFGDLVSEGDVVLLVMPQDIQAPKGRLILPQVQSLRELLDRKALVVSCTTDKLSDTLASLKAAPSLIVTDSQVFDIVAAATPEQSRLTSFSILMAGYKGDVETFMQGAKAIDNLTEKSRVLIAEGCAHAPATEDIGRVQIPRLLRRRVGEALTIDMVAGRNFPDDLSPYDLIIHCGGCMFNRKYVMNRVERSKIQNIPITNYGVVIAYIKGILDRVIYVK